MRRLIQALCALLLVLATAAGPGPAAAEPVTSAPVEIDLQYRRGLEALRVGQLDQAEAAALAILGPQPLNLNGRQLLGLVKARRGDLVGAVLEFDRVLAKDPKFVQAREERAVLLARLGRQGRARADLDALRARAAECGRACPPDLRKAVSRVEAALVAVRPAANL